MSAPLPPLCDPAEVAEMLGVDPPYQGAELAQVAWLCAQVSGLIRAQRPQIDLWMAELRVNPTVVTGIACQVVARVKTALALGGVPQSEQSPRETLDAAAAALVLRPNELALLTPPPADERTAFTIRPGAALRVVS